MWSTVRRSLNKLFSSKCLILFSVSFYLVIYFGLAIRKVSLYFFICQSLFGGVKGSVQYNISFICLWFQKTWIVEYFCSQVVSSHLLSFFNLYLVIALVLVPTRELCLQVHEILQKLLHRFHWIVPGYVMGGENRSKEKARLRKGRMVA